jgi:NTP pyrophosphatase (non-canonical NTP hydrolase)
MTTDIQEWLRQVYPDRKPEAVFAKLMDEIEELKDRPTDGWEAADVMILLLDFCELSGIDIVKAVHWKMERNRKRKWEMKDNKLCHIGEPV